MRNLITFDTVRQIALALPEVEDGTSYGTPALKVRKKLMIRLKEDGETIVVKVDFDERDGLIASNPESFHITDHYRGYPWMLVRLSAVHIDDLRERIHDAWRLSAPPKLVAAYESAVEKLAQ